MEKFRYHKGYSVHFKISLIISEIIFILLFLFTPSLPSKKNRMISLDEISTAEIIPPTIIKHNPISLKPALPEIKIANVIIEDFFLEDVNLYKNENHSPVANLENNINNKTNPLLNSIPRQILEVLPQQIDGEFHGSITLKLKINENGKVDDYKILTSDINCNKCINKVLEAAYESIWEPALIKGKTIEYWIEKTYNFN